MTVLESPKWAPAVQDVANRLMSRTRGANGSLVGNFNGTTIPTDTQVTAIIAQAVSLLRNRLGPVPDALVDQAQALTALRAAYMVELSYFPEQVDTGVSPYRALIAEYLTSLKEWDTSARGESPNDVNIASMPVGTLYPSYAIGW